MSTTTTTKQRTITLTDRPPVTIREDAWPVIATAKWWDNTYECQANRTASIRVRQHADGRRIVYGVADSQWQGERGAKAGILIRIEDDLLDNGETVRAIRFVADLIGYPELATKCVANLPAEVL